jgi:NitT/TauT family transport system permease protein
VVLTDRPKARMPASGLPAGALSALWRSKELVLTLLAAIAAWFIVVEVTDLHPIVLPSPGAVWDVMVNDWSTLVREALWSFYEMFLGFGVGAVLGFALAIAVFYLPFFQRGVYPYLFGFRAVPKVAFLPLLVIWFGVGLTVKVVIATTAVFFVVLVQTLLGLSTVDPSLIELGRSLKMSEPLLLRRVRIPAALPAIMVGVKLGITYALTMVVVAEMFVATNGLGFLVVRARQQARTDLIIAVIIVTAIAGLLVYQLGRFVERRTTFWYFEDQTG